jgi:hypothetical protein
MLRNVSGCGSRTCGQSYKVISLLSTFYYSHSTSFGTNFKMMYTYFVSRSRSEFERDRSTLRLLTTRSSLRSHKYNWSAGRLHELPNSIGPLVVAHRRHHPPSIRPTAQPLQGARCTLPTNKKSPPKLPPEGYRHRALSKPGSEPSHCPAGGPSRGRR